MQVLTMEPEKKEQYECDKTEVDPDPARTDRLIKRIAGPIHDSVQRKFEITF
jgi:hypothetical protein